MDQTTVRGADVTIGLPVYNGERYLDEALASLRGQDFETLEIVIGDNGSDDATEAICRSHARDDNRILYLRSPVNRGATWNYNRLVDVASGRFFKWAAHDDLCEPSFVRRCVEALEAGGEGVVLAYPGTLLVDEHGEVIDHDFVDGLDRRERTAAARLRRYGAHVGEQHAVFGLIRTANLRRTRLISPCWGGDMPLLAALLVQGQFVEIPDRLFRRRYHPGSSMVANATPEQVVAWFDPRRSGRPALPRTHLFGELMRTVAAADLSAPARARAATAFAAGWVPRYGRVMGGELKAVARDRIRRAARSWGVGTAA